VEIRSLHFVIAMARGWLQREQGGVIAYLKEENKVLREQLGTTPPPRAKGKACWSLVVGRLGLVALGCIVTPDTILRWYRQLVAAKYDGQSPQCDCSPAPIR
jgi:putative transposase